jgi:NADH-quinone oxidoreductase subunit D
MPIRGQLIRVLYSEIGRILSHIMNVTTQAMDVGAMTPPLWGFEEREKLMVFYERACGARMHSAYFRPGGVHQDMPPELVEDIGKWMRSVPEDARRYRRPADRQPHLQAAQRRYRRRLAGRCVGLGLFGRHGARFGRCLGPARSQPYECYSDMDFDIPIGKNGDCFDRYLIRMIEMRQSAKIMRQCVDRLLGDAKDGPVSSIDGKVVPPKRGEMKRSMEALIHHFKLYTEGYHVPAGEVYAAVEAPKGEFGVYLISDGTNKPYRCKIRAPGYAHLQAMDFLCGPSARGRLGRSRLARYRVRRGRSLMRRMALVDRFLLDASGAPAFAQETAPKSADPALSGPRAAASMGRLLSKGYEIKAAVPNGAQIRVFCKKTSQPTPANSSH